MYLPDFLWKHRRPITVVVLLSLACLIMIDSLHRKWVARAGSELVVGLVSPIQKTSETMYDGGRNVLSVIPDFFRTRAQNVALKKHVGQLNQEIVTLREELLEERRLRDLDGFAGTIKAPKVVARVIGTNPTAWFSAIMIDKGSTYGVRKDLPAISSSGLVGYVIEAYLYSSKVLLLTDSNSKVSVIVQRSRAQGVVQGDDEGGCLLKYLEPTADVSEGDVVITSGNSRIYPKGLLVGYVSEVRAEPGSLFQWARIIPATDVKKLEEVAVIVTPHEPEPRTDPTVSEK